MSLREYRRGDGAAIALLWERNPTAEMPMLGFDPERVREVFDGLDRPIVRLVLWFLEVTRREVIRAVIAEEDGRVVGTTLVSFTPEAAYVSAVVVEAAYRRRGIARAMLAAADAAARKRHRAYQVLEVAATSDGARRLYESVGYRARRVQRFLVRPMGPAAPVPPPGPSPDLRPFRAEDGKALAAHANAALPPELRGVVPTHPGDFRAGSRLAGALRAESAAWVAPARGPPLGFVRATRSGAVEAGHLTAPLVADGLSDPAARDLLGTALGWLQRRGASRAVTEIPETWTRSLALARGLGFQDRLELLTMVRASAE